MSVQRVARAFHVLVTVSESIRSCSDFAERYEAKGSEGRPKLSAQADLLMGSLSEVKRATRRQGEEELLVWRTTEMEHSPSFAVQGSGELQTAPRQLHLWVPLGRVLMRATQRMEGDSAEDTDDAKPNEESPNVFFAQTVTLRVSILRPTQQQASSERSMVNEVSPVSPPSIIAESFVELSPSDLSSAFSLAATSEASDDYEPEPIAFCLAHCGPVPYMVRTFDGTAAHDFDVARGVQLTASCVMAYDPLELSAATDAITTDDDSSPKTVARAISAERLPVRSATANAALQCAYLEDRRWLLLDRVIADFNDAVSIYAEEMAELDTSWERRLAEATAPKPGPPTREKACMAGQWVATAQASTSTRDAPGLRAQLLPLREGITTPRSSRGAQSPRDAMQDDEPPEPSPRAAQASDEQHETGRVPSPQKPVEDRDNTVEDNEANGDTPAAGEDAGDHTAADAAGTPEHRSASPSSPVASPLVDERRSRVAQAAVMIEAARRRLRERMTQLVTTPRSEGLPSLQPAYVATAAGVSERGRVQQRRLREAREAFTRAAAEPSTRGDATRWRSGRSATPRARVSSPRAGSSAAGATPRSGRAPHGSDPAHGSTPGRHSVSTVDSRATGTRSRGYTQSVASSSRAGSARSPAATARRRANTSSAVHHDPTTASQFTSDHSLGDVSPIRSAAAPELPLNTAARRAERLEHALHGGDSSAAASVRRRATTYYRPAEPAHRPRGNRTSTMAAVAGRSRAQGGGATSDRPTTPRVPHRLEQL